MEGTPTAADVILLGIVAFALSVAAINWAIDAIAHSSLRFRIWLGHRFRH